MALTRLAAIAEKLRRTEGVLDDLAWCVDRLREARTLVEQSLEDQDDAWVPTTAWEAWLTAVDGP